MQRCSCLLVSIYLIIQTLGCSTIPQKNVLQTPSRDSWNCVYDAYTLALANGCMNKNYTGIVDSIINIKPECMQCLKMLGMKTNKINKSDCKPFIHKSTEEMKYYSELFNRDIPKEDCICFYNNESEIINYLSVLTQSSYFQSIEKEYDSVFGKDNKFYGIRYGENNALRKTIIYYRDGLMLDIGVVEGKDGKSFLSINAFSSKECNN